MRRQIGFTIGIFIIIAGGLWSPVAADCQVNGVTGNNGTAGDDNIVCDNSPAQPIDTTVAGGAGGNDVIIVNSDNQVIILGDGTAVNPVIGTPVNAAGDDTITVNGDTGAFVAGDLLTADVDGGDDTIIINGTSGSVEGDDIEGTSTGGDDTIIINGTANGQVNGDFAIGPNAAAVETGGNDTIIINGTADSVAGELFFGGGADVGGNDVIIITDGAQVNGNVTGEQGVVIGGDDDVTVEVGAVITGVISGGNAAGDFDTLTLTGTTSDAAGYNQLQALVGCNPCNGSVTIDGITYTFQNFEQLVNLLVLVASPNAVLPVTIRINPEPPPTLLCGDNADGNNLLMYRLWTGELEFYSGMQLNPSQPFLVGKVSRGDLENGLRSFTVPETAHPGWRVDVLDMADARDGYFAQIYDSTNQLIAQSCPFTIS